MRKEETDKIRKLINEGLTNVEIHEQTGASDGYISKLKKEMNQGGVDVSPSIIQLSEKSQRYLLLMQTAMGLKDTNAAVEKFYNDFLLINSKKIRFDPNNEKSIGEVFLDVVKKYDERPDMGELLERVRDNDFHRHVMLANLGIDELTFFLYNYSLGGRFRGTIIDYFNEAVKQDYIALGWSFSEYYNSKLNEYHTKIILPSRDEILLPIE